MTILVLLIIIILTIELCKIYNVDFAKALPLAIFFMTNVVFLSGFLNNLYIGILILVITFLLSVGSIIKHIFINKKASIYVTILNDINLYVFVIAFFIIYFYCTNINAQHIDEILFWEPFCNDLFLRNKFYFTEGHIATVHLSYPPFVSLFQYIYCKFAGNYTISNLYRAKQVLQFSMIFSLMSYVRFDVIKLKWNFTKIIKYFLTLLILVLIYTVYSYEFFKLLLIDGLLGLIFGYLVFGIYKADFNNKFDIMNIILSGIALVLTKQMGIALFHIAIMVLFVLLLLDKCKWKKKLNVLLSCYIIPIMFDLFWIVFSRIAQVNDQFDLDKKLSLNSLYCILFQGGGLDYQKQTIANFIRKIFFEELFVHINIVILFFAIILAYVFLILIIDKKLRVKSIIITIIMNIGFVLYVFALLCLYLFCFSEQEAVGLACLKRYILTYITAFVTVWVFTFVYSYYYSKNNMVLKNIVSVIVIISFFVILYITNSIRFIML